jgi:endonuclease/exonuclease/phosphatase family metal-dependent hydrolase
MDDVHLSVLANNEDVEPFRRPMRVRLSAYSNRLCGARRFLPAEEGGSNDESVFQHKLGLLAAVIDQEAPDVLALQEIGSEGALTALQNRLGRPMLHAAVGEPDRRGIRVAVLSVPALTSTAKHRGFPDTLRPIQSRDLAFDDPATPADEASTSQMGRGALEVSIDVDGTPVTVLTAHFKSKLITYPNPPGASGGTRFSPRDEGERHRYAGYAVNLRTAEAVTIRARLDALLDRPGDPRDGTGRDTAVVFCGDLNDEVEAATTQIIKGPGGSEIDLRPGSGFSRPDRGDGHRMWNLAPLLPAAPDGTPPFTRVFKGRGELIDHIFATHRLVNPQRLPTPHTMQTAQPLPSVDETPTARRDDPGSDHAAVVAAFEV